MQDKVIGGLMSQDIITAERVEKRYTSPAGADVAVLRGVSLGVRKGEFVCLMGASGSGKTTLLNLVGGLDTADKGSITVEGRHLESLDDDGRSGFRLRHLGFVFQFFNLLPNLTVVENVALPLLFLGTREAEAHARAAAMLAEVGLAEKTRRLANQLSGGEMQRVGIARALVHQPTVLLADEPTGNLDSRTGSAILDLLRQTAAGHRATLLMATHDAKAADRADRVVHMVDGQIVEERA